MRLTLIWTNLNLHTRGCFHISFGFSEQAAFNRILKDVLYILLYKISSSFPIMTQPCPWGPWFERQTWIYTTYKDALTQYEFFLANAWFLRRLLIIEFFSISSYVKNIFSIVAPPYPLGHWFKNIESTLPEDASIQV